jgi:GTP-binding protein EngB required for normal cell division
VRENYTNEAGTLDEKAYRARNNLVFVDQPGYNYDRERKQGEGEDWQEPAE